MKKTKKKASLKVLQTKSTRLIRQEFMDYDYVDKLSPEEKQWLADFTDEHYNASVGKQSDEGKDNRFYKSKELVKESQTNNNKRNNDVFGKAKAKKNIVFSQSEYALDYQMRDIYNKDRLEDALIEVLDKRNDLNNTCDHSDEESDNTD